MDGVSRRGRPRRDPADPAVRVDAMQLEARLRTAGLTPGALAAAVTARGAPVKRERVRDLARGGGNTRTSVVAAMAGVLGCALQDLSPGAPRTRAERETSRVVLFPGRFWYHDMNDIAWSVDVPTMAALELLDPGREFPPLPARSESGAHAPPAPAYERTALRLALGLEAAGLRAPPAAGSLVGFTRVWCALRHANAPEGARPLFTIARATRHADRRADDLRDLLLLGDDANTRADVQAFGPGLAQLRQDTLDKNAAYQDGEAHRRRCAEGERLLEWVRREFANRRAVAPRRY